MKRMLLGGFLSLIGCIWSTSIVFIASNNLVSTFSSDIGRLWSTVVDMNLMLWFIVSIIFVVLGIVIMAFEFFNKEK